MTATAPPRAAPQPDAMLLRRSPCAPDAGAAPRVTAAARPDETGSASALELMALTPMCALLVAFVSWAGNTGQAQLAATLAAQEAAVAAALCCADADAAATAVFDPDTARQLAAETVITARPSLQHLCLGGPQPGISENRWTAYTTAEPPSESAPDRPDTAQDLSGTATDAAGESEPAGPDTAVTTTHLICVADGAAAPLRGLFGTRTVHGHGTHIARTAHTGPAAPRPTTPTTGDTP